MYSHNSTDLSADFPVRAANSLEKLEDGLHTTLCLVRRSTQPCKTTSTVYCGCCGYQNPLECESKSLVDFVTMPLTHLSRYFTTFVFTR